MSEERNPFEDPVPADGIGHVRRDWFRVYYGQLRGAVVEGVRIDAQRWWAYPALILRKTDGSRVLVRVRTRPGGRPGHLEIEPLAGQKEKP